MKRGIIFFLVFFCSVFIKSQAQISITGTVIDSAGRKLQNATVSVISSNNKSVLGFCITDTNGYFAIRLLTTENSFIRVSSIGYKTIEKEIIGNIFNYNFKLYAGTYMLPEVIVKSQPLIISKGDTLEYDVKQFVRTQDRTIADIIKNLPGITVSPTGAISYNGRPINKFYIDGDDILGDKYAIGANTLPADVVRTIQVLENHQPIKMLEDRTFSENAALNIKLEKSAKLRIFGSGNISSGLPYNSTDARVNMLSFKKKLKFINSYSFNSIGNDFTNEIKSQNISSLLLRQSYTMTPQLLSFTKLSNPEISDRYFVNNSSHLITLNKLIPISKDKSLRFSLYYLPDNNTFDTKAKNTFYIQPDTINQFENQIKKLKKDDLYFTCIYLVNSKEKYIQNQLTFESTPTNGSSAIENERNNFTQTLKNRSKNFENSFFFKSIIGRKFIFEATSKIKYSKLFENLSVGLGLYPWLLNNSIDYNKTNQLITQDYINISTEVSVTRKIKQFNLNLKTEFFAENTNYITWLNLIQLNNESKMSDNAFQNKLKWNQQRIQSTPSIDFKSKRLQFSVSLPVLFRVINYANKSSIFDTSLNRVSLHPTLNLNFTISNYSRILLNIRRETDFTQPYNILSGGILSNYRNLSQNAQTLQFSYNNTFALNYTYRNPIKIKFFNTSLIYSSNFSPIISTQNFNLGLIQNNQLLFSNTTQRVMALSNYSKYIFPLKTTLKFGYSGSITDYFQAQNNFINNLRSITHSTNVGIIAKPKWYFNCELNFNYINTRSKNLITNFIIGQPIHLFNTNIITTFNFSENTFIQLETSHIIQKAINSYGFILSDFRLNHTIPNTKTDIGFKVINIFNQKRFIITNLDGLQVSTNDYWLRPLTIMLSASFRF